MDRVRDILMFFAASMAVFALICCIYQAMHDQVAAAALLAAVFLVCVMVVFLPRLEILEAWGVKAHLVRTLNEADVILDKLRRSAVLSAKTSYMNAGWGNRMATPSARDKQAMLDEIDNQLRDLNVPAEERKALSKSYVKIIGFDMYMMYVRTLQRYVQFKQQAMQTELNKDSNSPIRVELESWRSGTQNWKINYSLFEALDTYSFEDEVRRATPSGWLNESDQRAADIYRNELTTLFRGVQAKGGFTPEAADYYDKYQDLGGQDKKIIELFGFNPSEPR
ncbi:hypothetical protein ACVWWO_000961 [Bradyrhizobium sp. F1.13.1]